MNRKEFLDELNKRKDSFILNQNKYYSVVTDSFDTDGGEKKAQNSAGGMCRADSGDQ